MTEPHSWMDFAREDLRVAELALTDGLYNQVCFHAQQGVEKALKAFLKSRQQSVPRTHALTELLTLCRGIEHGAERLEFACEQLDQYYLPTRYPDALPGMGPEWLPMRQDAEEALELLRTALKWVEERLR